MIFKMEYLYSTAFTQYLMKIISLPAEHKLHVSNIFILGFILL